MVVDADVLGRRRTGDETYVRNLLRTLPAPAAEAGLDLAAVTRRPELVPDGVAAGAAPGALAGAADGVDAPAGAAPTRRALVHTQYALPLRCPAPPW